MYDLENIKKIADGDEAFVKILVKAFIEEVPSDVAAMTEAVDNGNAALAYQFSHKLKPNLKSFGLELENEVDAIELWFRKEKNNAVAQKAAKKINSSVEATVVELTEDFNLE